MSFFSGSVAFSALNRGCDFLLHSFRRWRLWWPRPNGASNELRHSKAIRLPSRAATLTSPLLSTKRALVWTRATLPHTRDRHPTNMQMQTGERPLSLRRIQHTCRWCSLALKLSTSYGRQRNQWKTRSMWTVLFKLQVGAPRLDSQGDAQDAR